MNGLTTLTPKQLRKAANVQEKIAALQKQLGKLLGSAAGPGVAGERPGKRKFSAATRRAMAAAQKARWAKIRGTTVAATLVKKPRRRLSAAMKARLSAMAKARWKKAKAQGKTRL